MDEPNVNNLNGIPNFGEGFENPIIVENTVIEAPEGAPQESAMEEAPAEVDITSETEQ